MNQYQTFVSIGNCHQPFTRLLQMVEAHIELLPQPILIQRGHTPFHSPQCEVVDFISMDSFVQYVQTAKILILHGGAGSILHAIKWGKTPIVMPRREKYGEIINDHQLMLAEKLNAQTKVYLVNHHQDFNTAIKKLQTEQTTCAATDAAPAFAIIKKTLQQLLSN